MSQTKAIVCKEDKSTMSKIWDKMVDRYIKGEKNKIKHAPFALKIISILEPESAPILKPIEEFLKTDEGKKFTEIATNNYDALGSVMKFDFSTAKEQYGDSLKKLETEEGIGMIQGLKDTIVEVKGMSK